MGADKGADGVKLRPQVRVCLPERRHIQSAECGDLNVTCECATFRHDQHSLFPAYFMAVSRDGILSLSAVQSDHPASLPVRLSQCRSNMTSALSQNDTNQALSMKLSTNQQELPLCIILPKCASMLQIGGSYKK
jgi:hypothetical protein